MTDVETYLKLLNKLEELIEFYSDNRNIDSFDALVDEMVKLQLVETLNPGIHSFVEARTPATAKMAAERITWHLKQNQYILSQRANWTIN